MLDHGERAVGEVFRGAVQTAAHHFLAEVNGRAVGSIDCGTFDRATVYGGEGPEGPIITESIEVATGPIALAVDPALRRRGVGRVMIAGLLARPELAFVELFEAGVEPDNLACRRCLEQARAIAKPLGHSCPRTEHQTQRRVWSVRGQRGSDGATRAMAFD